MIRPVTSLMFFFFVATSMAAAAFAQGPGAPVSPAGMVTFRPAEAKPAGLPVSPAALAGFVGGQTLTQPEWQRQYDAARKRRKSGQTKVLIGVGLGVGGAVMIGYGMANMMIFPESNCGGSCHGQEALAVAGAAAAVGGCVSFWWGIMDWGQGNGAINRLEAAKPTGGRAHTVNLTEHQALQFSLGARASIGYRVAW